MGFSSRTGSAYLDDKFSFCFESTGDSVLFGERKKGTHARFNRADVIGVLLEVCVPRARPCAFLVL